MTSAWTLEVDDQWIAWLTLDVPGQSVNTLGSATLDELETHLEALHANEAVKALAIRSSKAKGFLAGAEIEELAAIADYEDAREKSMRGHAIFQRLADLPIPTVAVIHGACMGGGLELALACDFRLVTDDPSTKLALPEVKLGIIPGWGGTQRLPRLVGLVAALPMILAGKSMNSRRAIRMGLADGVVARTFLTESTTDFVNDVVRSGGRRRVLAKRRRRRPPVVRVMESFGLGRRYILGRARKETLAKTKGCYPAPLDAIDVLRRTARSPLADGLLVEAAGFAELACTPISRNLVSIFQASQRLKRVGARSERDAITRGGVVGAGIMGSGIAWAMSNAGIDVRLRDINWDAVGRGIAAIARTYRGLVKRRRMNDGAMNLAMHRVSGTTDASGFANLQIVVEAVAEDMEIKRTVLRDIEANVSADAIICTNTSSLPLADLASALKNPRRFVGLHFFNPVDRMPLVEVVPCKKTSPTTVIAAVEFVRSLGKTPVVVGDCPGFLVNRILLPYLVECAWMFEEGIAPQRLDRVLEEFGMPMGPLTLADEVGLDIGYKAAKVLEDAYGSRMQVAGVLDRLVTDEGLRGRKSGQGFYVYGNGKKKQPNRNLDAAVRTARAADGVTQTELTDDEIIDRAVLIMVNEAARCLDEKVVQDAEHLDFAMVMGTGFAPFRGGLLRYADERGVQRVHTRLREFAVTFGDRFEPAPLLSRLAERGGEFYGSESGSTEERA